MKYTVNINSTLNINVVLKEAYNEKSTSTTNIKFLNPKHL